MSMWTRLTLTAAAAAATLLVWAAPAAAQPSAPSANGCLTCHGSLTDPRLAQPARDFSDADVHRERGFACANCHGGDPAATEKAAGHNPARGFKGKPEGPAVIATCASCHSDATLMHRYAPRQRVDQATEYATSVHGQRLATGDRNVATCASCHGAHGIRAVSDARSPVFPTNVAGTCATCHADVNRMAAYKLPDGSPLPTDQYARYKTSVHYAALTKGNDLSAPTCNDCHGNHGAGPPGVGGAIVNVCGTCHAIFQQKFETSVHKQLFDKGCVECHGNHGIVQPSDAMLGTTAGAVCATCHSGSPADDPGVAGAQHMRAGIDGLKTGIDAAAGLIGRVRNAGIEVSDDELALSEAQTRLTLARTEMHTANPAAVDAVLAEGTKIVSGVQNDGEKGLTELRFRRRGLFVSLAAIVLVVLALALKLRQIERRNRNREYHV